MHMRESLNLHKSNLYGQNIFEFCESPLKISFYLHNNPGRPFEQVLLLLSASEQTGTEILSGSISHRLAITENALKFKSVTMCREAALRSHVELVRNAASQTPAQTYAIRDCVITGFPGDLMPIQVSETPIAHEPFIDQDVFPRYLKQPRGLEGAFKSLFI